MLVLACEQTRRADVLLDFCNFALQDAPQHTTRFSNEVCTLLVRTFKSNLSTPGLNLVWDIVERFSVKVDEILYTAALSSCTNPALFQLGQRIHSRI